MKKLYKKWVNHLISIFTSIIFIAVLVNYILDKDHIFRNTIQDECKIFGNERYGKFEYLEENFKKYDSYIIGGSRIGVIRPETVNKYFDHSNFYNLYTSVSRINESDQLIKYLIKNYTVKNIILQLSLYDINKMISSLPLHYKITGEKKVAYILKNLFSFNIFDKYEYSKILLSNPQALSLQPTNCDGTWDFQLLEDSITCNKTRYYESGNKFYCKNFRVNKLEDINEKMRHLESIVNQCKEKNIHLIICFIPENHFHMDVYTVDAYLNFIKSVAQTTDFWNFSGYNSVTTNDTNYYELMHFRYFIGDMMMAKIFNDTSYSIPADFGYLVTKSNVNDHINYLRKNIEDWDFRNKRR